MTYFWNGNRSGKVDENLEVYEEVPSDVIPFEKAPAMKSKEITEKMVENMASKKFQFLRCNFPNGDMVGHTGVFDAVVYRHGVRGQERGRHCGGCRQVRLHRPRSPPTTATPTR